MSNERAQPDVEVLDAEPAHLIRSPAVPTNLNDLAARKGEAVEIIEARVQVIETLRRASIRVTSPPDWLLYKSPEEQGGQTVGYLQDAGADRLRDLWGIEIFEVSTPEKIAGDAPGEFTYIQSGSGRCRITGQILENVEGGRSSKDDFCKGKTGADLELAVRKATRANLDGGITRELAGMKSVPISEIENAWIGTTKKIGDCRRGRGFGTHEERLGARSDKAPDVDPPICPHCGAAGVYRAAKGTRTAFYGCPKFSSHENKRWFQDAAEWQAAAAQRAAQATTAATGSAGPATTAATSGGPAGAKSGQAPAGRVTSDLKVDDVFGTGHKPAGREPGQEG